jgi:glycosyltransferase involved in cell wall biosynthesis
MYINSGKRSISQAIYFGLSCLKILKEDFDVVDCCGFPFFSLFACKIVCKIKGKKLYSTWHEVWGKDYWEEYLGKKGTFGSIVERMASILPDKIISVSEHTTNDLIRKLKVSKNKIVTIPNSLDIKNINSIKPSKEKSDVIFVGRLLNHKNVDMLIKAVNIIKRSNPKIKCIIIGDGPEREHLKDLVKELKVENNIIFKDFIDNHNNMLSLMKSSKVFVLPSSREGFGIVAIEANACGIPVVTVNHKDNAAKSLIIEGKNGFISSLNEENLALTIIRALKSYKSMKKACLNSVKQYDLSLIINKLEKVYEK